MFGNIGLHVICMNMYEYGCMVVISFSIAYSKYRNISREKIFHSSSIKLESIRIF